MSIGFNDEIYAFLGKKEAKSWSAKKWQLGLGQ